MSLFVVDVEADGPIPHKFSMVSFGAVRLDRSLETTFYGRIKPISDLWVPDSLKVSGVSREEHLEFDDPVDVMASFAEWIMKNSKGRPIFIADNPTFDWSWINYYFHMFYGSNPFGYSARRIGDLYCGLMKDGRAQWKHLRKTKHTHNPVDDAMGNAQALLHMVDVMGLKLGVHEL